MCFASDRWQCYQGAKIQMPLVGFHDTKLLAITIAGFVPSLVNVLIEQRVGFLILIQKRATVAPYQIIKSIRAHLILCLIWKDGEGMKKILCVKLNSEHEMKLSIVLYIYKYQLLLRNM